VQGHNGAVAGCTTSKHKTHKTECLRVQYPWHPLYTQTVIIRHKRLRRGRPTAACVPENDPERASLEIPEWMFDRALCSQMRVKEQPWVCWKALAELTFLLQQTGCVSTWSTVKHQHRSFGMQGGPDASPRSIPSARTTEPVSSTPKATPMEGGAE
jgi:hypothetical protein